MTDLSQRVKWRETYKTPDIDLWHPHMYTDTYTHPYARTHLRTHTHNWGDDSVDKGMNEQAQEPPSESQAPM